MSGIMLIILKLFKLLERPVSQKSLLYNVHVKKKSQIHKESDAAQSSFNWCQAYWKR